MAAVSAWTLMSSATRVALDPSNFRASSSSELTLQTMLILALIGMPLVLGYTIWLYKAFSGKNGVDSKQADPHY